MKRYGVEWKSDGFGDWYGSSGRFSISIWRFGPRFQCKVFVKYPQAKEDPDIGLPISESRDEAMQRGVAWIKQFEENGPGSPDEVFSDCYNHYKSIYQYRHQVIEQLFFVIGNGYDWLDGAIVSNSPYDHLEALHRQEDKWDAEEEEREKDWEALRARFPELGESPIAARRRKTIGPHPDDGRPLALYPVSEGYSNIFLVPDDVTDEWLQVAYEAAIMLRDRSSADAVQPRLDIRLPHDPELAALVKKEREDRAKSDRVRQEQNRQAGVKIVKDLERRFGDRIK